jgi:hypothetical protein
MGNLRIVVNRMITILVSYTAFLTPSLSDVNERVASFPAFLPKTAPRVSPLPPFLSDVASQGTYRIISEEAPTNNFPRGP